MSEVELERELAAGRRAREQIVREHTGMVYTVIARMEARHGLDRGVDKADLAQEGCVQLLKAAEYYNYRKNTRFVTYAFTAVQNRLLRVIQEQARVMRLPTHLYEKYGAVKRAAKAVEQRSRSGEDATSEQICAELSQLGFQSSWVTPSGVDRIVGLIERPAKSLDAGLQGLDNLVLMDKVASDGHQRATALEGFRDDLRILIEHVLEPEEARMLSLRFGLETHEPMTFRKVAEAMGATETTYNDLKVKRRINRALEKLRDGRLSPLGILDFTDFADMEAEWGPG
jgi:RNA polymerase primary sigma factor